MASDLPLILSGSALALGLVGSALASGLETGFYVLDPVQLRHRALGGDTAARRVEQERRQPGRLLALLLLLTNSMNYLATFGLGGLLAHLATNEGLAIAIEALVITPLVFVLGESLPKEIFRRHADRLVYTLSAPLPLLRWAATIVLLLPFVQIMQAMASRLSGKRSGRTENARGRIARLLKEGARQGVIGDQHTELIDRILSLRVRRVRTRMVPWARVTTISRSLDPESRRRVLKRSRFTRLPVVDNDGRLVGVLNTVRALSDPDRATVDLMRQPLLLDANDSMLDAIDRLRSEGRGMGIVVKAGTLTPLGVVTVKDLVEPLTGELAAW